jgi:hypothetical protein
MAACWKERKEDLLSEPFWAASARRTTPSKRQDIEAIETIKIQQVGTVLDGGLLERKERKERKERILTEWTLLGGLSEERKENSSVGTVTGGGWIVDSTSRRQRVYRIVVYISLSNSSRSYYIK